MTEFAHVLNRWARAFWTASLLVMVFAASPLAAAEAEPAAGASWLPTIAKTLNLAILVGVLVYFLRGLVASYLRSRGETIRKDLLDAAALRASAEEQLAGVRARLAGLPAEIDALRRRGRDELAAERARMKDATDKERARLLERTRRDIDLQLRQSRRELLEHTADLAMTLARTRIERDITPADHDRLIERYATEVRP